VNVSSISNRSVAGRLLRLPLALIPGVLPMPVLQGPLRGHWWITGSSNHGCWLGSYEYTKQRLFARMIRTGDVVFDIGANVGFYTLLAAARAMPEGMVVAFEPLGQNARFIHRHLRLNNIDRVQVIEAAVGDTNGTVRFKRHASNAMGRVSEDGSLVVELGFTRRTLRCAHDPRPNADEDRRRGSGAERAQRRSADAAARPSFDFPRDACCADPSRLLRLPSQLRLLASRDR